MGQLDHVLQSGQAICTLFYSVYLLPTDLAVGTRQGRQVVQSFGLPPEAAGGLGFDAVGPGELQGVMQLSLVYW